MRQVNIFFKNFWQCRFTCFVRFANMKLFCKSGNQNKNNFTHTTLTKHVNNQTNFRILYISICTKKISHIKFVTWWSNQKTSFLNHLDISSNRCQNISQNFKWQICLVDKQDWSVLCTIYQRSTKSCSATGPTKLYLFYVCMYIGTKSQVLSRSQK